MIFWIYVIAFTRLEITLAVSLIVLSLPGGRTYNMDEKTEAMAKYLFNARSASGKSIAETLRFVLYGGAKADLPQRLWEATMNPEYRLEHLGISALGELVGWALPLSATTSLCMCEFSVGLMPGATDLR